MMSESRRSFRGLEMLEHTSVLVARVLAREIKVPRRGGQRGYGPEIGFDMGIGRVL